MKRWARVLFFAFFVIAGGVPAVWASLLSAQEFPKNVSDLSFIDRTLIAEEGYDTYESEYDAAGNCISGCPFPGVTLSDVIAESDRATKEANDNLAQYYAHTSNNDDEEYTDDEYDDEYDDSGFVPSAFNFASSGAGASNRSLLTAPDASSGEYVCPTNQYSKYIARGNRFVNMSPLDTDLIVVSDIGERSVKNGSRWHQGLDLRAVDNTPIYLPANGVVTMVGGGPNSGAGYYIWVYHPVEKIYTRYLHLSKQLVKTGDRIAAGCMIAKSGHSGIGKAGKPYAPHLHYEIKKSQSLNRSDVIDPFGGINRLGRNYRFKSRGSLRSSRNSVCPIGCTGFLY